MRLYGRRMRKQPRIPISEKLRKAMDDLGAEPLEGSGFEDEVPDENVREADPTTLKTPR
jgi:hypothetical protein